MPNECHNMITIIYDDIDVLFKEELEQKVGEMYPYDNIQIDKKAKRGIIFSQTTRWDPDYTWLESLMTKYSKIWIKDEWTNYDAATAGIWIGSQKDGTVSYQWNDLPMEGYHEIFELETS
jgi:hypothetical protein